MRFDTDLSRYEPLGDVKPGALISSHPSGQYVALQVTGMPLNRAAVWETATGRLVCAPRVDLAAVFWLEQSCAGVDLVALGEVQDKQLEDGSCSVSTNWVTGPLFSRPAARFRRVRRCQEYCGLIQQSNTDQQIAFRNRWSSSTSSRIACGSWSRCQRHSSRPVASPSACRAALIA
jgi:hypothetical protein